MINQLLAERPNLSFAQYPDKQSWLASRIGTVGGTDIYNRIRGLKLSTRDFSRYTPPPVVLGQKFERPVVEIFSEYIHRAPVVHFNNSSFLNKNYPAAHASIDGLTDDGESIVEVKICTSEKVFAEYGVGDKMMPIQYWWQIQFYQFLLELDNAYLVVYCGFSKSPYNIDFYQIIKNEEAHEAINTYLINFNKATI